MSSGQMYEQSYQHNEPGQTEVLAVVSYASGTPTLVRGKGVASITDGGTGLLTVTLMEEHAVFMGGHVSPLLDATAGIKEQFGASTDVVTAKEVYIRFFDVATGAALTDPADGTYYINIKLLTQDSPVIP